MEVLGRARRVVQRHRGCAAQDERAVTLISAQVVASPVTYRGRAAQDNWTRSLEELEKRVAAYQFDVALLSCGSYGLPLGHYITHHLGATAIYVGGALQLFFGLRGLRWKREIAPYASDAWACPERPKWDTSGMENYGLGPYWCPPAKNGS